MGDDHMAKSSTTAHQSEYAMVDAMIKLARTLKFEIVAEHVEDDEALETIRELGVDYVQGYLLGRPMPLQSSN